MIFTVCLTFLLGITPALTARILGIMSVPSYSHQIVYRPLWRELSLRGHQVTVITTDPVNDPSLTNLTEIDLHFSYKTWDEKFDMVKISKLNTFDLLNYVIGMTPSILAEQLKHPAVQDLIRSDTEHFDVALIEPLFPGVMVFSEKFNCPLIQILPLDALVYTHHSIGNPAHPVLNPEIILGFPKTLSFFQRLASTFTSLLMEYYYYPRILKGHQELVNKYFGNKYPTLEEIHSRTSMMFINTNTIFHRLRPLLPNVIPIGGGAHFTTPKPLPQVCFLFHLN